MLKFKTESRNTVLDLPRERDRDIERERGGREREKEIVSPKKILWKDGVTY